MSDNCKLCKHKDTFDAPCSGCVRTTYYGDYYEYKEDTKGDKEECKCGNSLFRIYDQETEYQNIYVFVCSECGTSESVCFDIHDY